MFSGNILAQHLPIESLQQLANENPERALVQIDSISKSTRSPRALADLNLLAGIAFVKKREPENAFRKLKIFPSFKAEGCTIGSVRQSALSAERLQVGKEKF